VKSERLAATASLMGCTARLTENSSGDERSNGGVGGGRLPSRLPGNPSEALICIWDLSVCVCVSDVFLRDEEWVAEVTSEAIEGYECSITAGTALGARVCVCVCVCVMMTDGVYSGPRQSSHLRIFCTRHKAPEHTASVQKVCVCAFAQRSEIYVSMTPRGKGTKRGM